MRNEVEVEKGEAMPLDEYDAVAPVPVAAPVAAAPAAAAPVAAAAPAPAPAPAATPQEAQETIVLELPDQQPQRSVSANFLDADNDGVPDSPDNTVIR